MIRKHQLRQRPIEILESRKLLAAVPINNSSFEQDGSNNSIPNWTVLASTGAEYGG